MIDRYNMDLQKDVCQVLDELGPGKMANTVYDTAWLARLGDVDRNLSEQALDWICSHQLPDGSWGTGQVYYYHDRVICTLAAMTALARRGPWAHDLLQIRRGQQSLERIASGATRGLSSDPNGATVGFEMIVPTLVAEAEELNIIQHQGERILGRLGTMRQSKLAKLRDYRINRHVTVAFSAEMAGTDKQNLLDIDYLQEANGSVGHSPSATAYFALEVKPGDVAALSYLHSVTSHKGVPDLAPFDVFERVWVLWNLAIVGGLDDQIQCECQPHLDYLEAAWDLGTGLSFSTGYTPKDADNTIVGYDLLRQFGRSADLAAVLSYEDIQFFRCYPLESQPSTGVNIHALSALRQAGFGLDKPTIQKTLRFLRQTRIDNAFWLDKWHISPYYAAAHAVIACAGYVDDLVNQTIEWILTTQRAEGAWGFYGATAEETAYCLQALMTWRQHGNPVPIHRLERGVAWLVEQLDQPYPPLWLGKCLYCPELIVKSAILSALLMWEHR